MASKSFITRLNEADALTSSIEQAADGVGADLEQLWAPVLREGETMPDMALALRLLGRTLAVKRDDMKASNAGAKELQEHRAGRHLRQATAELRQMVIKYRPLIYGPYGAGTLQQHFGITGRTPRNSDALELLVERILKRLRDPEIEHPPNPGTVKTFPHEWIPLLEPLLRRLQEARKGAYGETREGHGALGGKHRDQEAYDVYSKPLGWVVKGLYAMTGRLELFKKLRLGAARPATKKKRQAAKPVSDSDETSAT